MYQDTGIQHSRLLEEQREQNGGDGLGGPLRFSDPCIFWLHSNMDGMIILPVCGHSLGSMMTNFSPSFAFLVFDKRLDKRVDEMLSSGLIEELKDFHHRFNEKKIQESR